MGRVEAERGPTVRAEGDPDAGACDAPNYPDLMVLKGGAAVPQQAGLVPLSDDAGKVEAVPGRSDAGHRAGLRPVRR
jgi:hypothetical protein